MIDVDDRAMYQELIDATRRPVREDYPQPNITARELAELEGITPAAAYNRLEKSVTEKKVIKGKEKVVIDNHSTCIYWSASLGDGPA